jgi:hypothetical protein
VQWRYRFQPSDRPTLPPRYKLCPVCRRFLVGIKEHMESDHPAWVAQRVRALRTGRGPSRPDWTPIENRVVVRAYFWLLAQQRLGRNPNKRELLRRLQAQLRRRTRGSIEFKLENISAVLYEKGYRWVEGYKPARNYQLPLRASVLLALRKRGARFARRLQDRSASRGSADPEVPPPQPPVTSRVARARRILVRTTQWALVDARNRELGRQGEDWVISFERARLRRLGRHDLARRVDRAEGDEAGYDVRSYMPSGRQLWLEVKTTRGSASRPFLLSRNELRTWRESPRKYRLYRVFTFGRRPQFFQLIGSPDRWLTLDASVWEARLARAHRRD